MQLRQNVDWALGGRSGEALYLARMFGGRARFVGITFNGRFNAAKIFTTVSSRGTCCPEKARWIFVRAVPRGFREVRDVA